MSISTPFSGKRLQHAVIEVMVSAVAVLCFTTLILLLAGAPPLKAFYYLGVGALGSWSKFAHVLKAWIPLTLCAGGLLYTFRINLWNIGVEGQVIMGAVFATAMLRWGETSAHSQAIIITAFAAGAMGGALWALLAGFLKTKGGVNEIFAGLGLNFVAQGAVLWLIFGPWKRPGVASMSGTAPFAKSLWLPGIEGWRFSPVGVALAIAAIVATAILLRYSRVGLNLRAIGSNSAAAFLFGLKPPHHMLLAMVFAGGFAGLAGCYQITDVYHRLIPAISSNYGYLSLLVVMLSNYNAWAAPAVAFFFACLNVGSIQLPMMLELDSSLSGVIQGALVLATLAVHAWRQRQRKVPRQA